MNMFKKTLIMGVSLISLTACQQLQKAFEKDTAYNGAEETSAHSFSNFSDIPVPEESSMNIDKTRVFGENDTWVGTLVMNSPFKLGNIFDFYSSQMTEFGWKKLSVIRGEQTILTYVKGGRIATIYVEETSLSGTEISFTLSPIPNEIKNMFLKKDVKNNYSSSPVAKIERQAIAQEQITMPSINTSLNITDVSESGALNLGDASNRNYNSDSIGVGAPAPTTYQSQKVKPSSDFYNF